MGKEIADAWKMIDEGLRSLMDRNDELTDKQLIAKSRRLRHLAKFLETLAKRIDERIKGVKVGSIDPLFEAFFKARAEVDKQTN